MNEFFGLNNKGVLLAFGYDRLRPRNSCLPFRLGDVFDLVSARQQDNVSALKAATMQDHIDGFYQGAQSDRNACAQALTLLDADIKAHGPDATIILDISRDPVEQLAQRLKYRTAQKPGP